MCLFLFFKQKTSYELRISDWSSDVCSSDLRGIVDTTDSALYVRGGGNLADQTIDLDVEADAKDFSLLDIDAPVHFEGKIRAPEISIGEGVQIPILELGDGEDVPCEPLLEAFMRAPGKRRQKCAGRGSRAEEAGGG